MDLLRPYGWSRVAVVDDDAPNAMLIAKLLEYAGLEQVEMITDSRRVEQWISQGDGDLLLMDLHMPRQSGYEILTSLRQRYSPTDLPVIVLTGDTSRDASRRALELGANDFLIKPIEAPELVHRVRNLLEVRNAHQALHQRQYWLEAAERFVRRIDAGPDDAVHADLIEETRLLAQADVICFVSESGDPGSCGAVADGAAVLPSVSIGDQLRRQLHDDPRPRVICTAIEPAALVFTETSEVSSAVVLQVGEPGGAAYVVLGRHIGTKPFGVADADDANQFLGRTTAALELARRREENRQYLAFFEVLVTQVTDYAIVGLDEAGHIASWNAGASRFLRADADRARGQSVSGLWPLSDSDGGLPDRLLAQARSGELAAFEGWLLRADNEQFWGDLSITALHGDRGNLLGYALVIRDQTESRRLEQAREIFFASVSHDIRAPLTAIQGFVEMIPIAEPERQDEFVQRVRNNVARLGVMVDNMLDHARLRAGAMPMVPAPLDLGALTATCIHDLSPVLSEHTVVPPEEGVMVFADESATTRVLVNVLINAAKYSPPGTTIHCRAENTAAGGRVTVSDQGRGIAPGDLDSIFEDFERGSFAEQDGGSGLGLSSAYRLVSLQGGQVVIESDVGGGTSVAVTLPPGALTSA
jgi:PAS domain S-box-containing protein